MAVYEIREHGSKSIKPLETITDKNKADAIVYVDELATTSKKVLELFEVKQVHMTKLVAEAEFAFF